LLAFPSLAGLRLSRVQTGERLPHIYRRDRRLVQAPTGSHASVRRVSREVDVFGHSYLFGADQGAPDIESAKRGLAAAFCTFADEMGDALDSSGLRIGGGT
jgi:hypothetical protein